MDGLRRLPRAARQAWFKELFHADGWQRAVALAGQRRRLSPQERREVRQLRTQRKADERRRRNERVACKRQLKRERRLRPSNANRYRPHGSQQRMSDRKQRALRGSLPSSSSSRRSRARMRISRS